MKTTGEIREALVKVASNLGVDLCTLRWSGPCSMTAMIEISDRYFTICAQVHEQKSREELNNALFLRLVELIAEKSEAH